MSHTENVLNFETYYEMLIPYQLLFHFRNLILFRLFIYGSHNKSS